ncbi:Uncharacterised protein [Klebsiella pneumoniae]|nr:Uncharacterised protein [Klebsiella pneumoniae]
MVRMNSVSEICEMDIITDACSTIKLPANSGSLSKLCRKVLPNMLVICSSAPSSMEKIKKIAMRLFLNSAKASRPSMVLQLWFFCWLDTGMVGSVRVNSASSTESAAPIYSCIWLSSKPAKLTPHIAMIKPMVPQIRIGGKSVTISSPADFRR